MQKTLAILFGVMSAVKAYSVNGHMAVANIAQLLLEESDPNSLAGAINELRALQEYDAELVYREDMYPFIETSTFADDVKYHGHMWQSDFHFINFPFIDQPGKTIADYPGSDDIATRNVTEALKNICDWISGKNGEAYKDSYMYDYIQNRLYPDNEPVARSFALRLFIHYMGDIHQPFHTTARFNDNYPDGDKGANKFPIPYHYEADELHAVWDKGVYTLRGNISRPFTNTTYASFQTKVIEPYMAKSPYSLTQSVIANRDFDAWALESFAKAKTMYDGAVENEPLSSDYLDTNVARVEDDITLGGYRLAWATMYMYGDVTEQALFLQ